MYQSTLQFLITKCNFQIIEFLNIQFIIIRHFIIIIYNNNNCVSYIYNTYLCTKYNIKISRKIVSIMCSSR